MPNSRWSSSSPPLPRNGEWAPSPAPSPFSPRRGQCAFCCCSSPTCPSPFAWGCGVALVVAEPYRVRRLLAFLDPWSSPLDEGYQLIQSYYALGSGGLFGVGLFSSRQKYLFLPFAESDFILSVIGEETGFFGVICVLALFAVVAVRGVLIALRARDAFSCYAAAGVTAVITMQALMNAAVVCGAVPPTGLPLPFVSAGGSSLVCCFAAVGVLLAVSRHSSGVFLRVPSEAESPSASRLKFAAKRGAAA